MIPYHSFMQRFIESNQNGTDAELEQELIEAYKKMDADELLDEIDTILQTAGDITAVIYAALSFEEKAKTLTDDDLLYIVQSDRYSIVPKIIAIQTSELINNGRGVLDYSQFWELIASPETDAEVKRNLINYVSVRDESDVQVLVELALDNTGELVFHSMESLKLMAFDTALEISNTVLIDFKSYNTELVRGAAFVKSLYFQNLGERETNSTEKHAFISLCLEIFEYYGGYLGIYNEHALVADTMVFALIDMVDFDAVRAILSSDMIEDELKFYSITKNYPAIVRAINRGLSDEDFNLLLDAMDFIPVVELCELLIDTGTARTAEQESRLNQLLERANAMGSHALEHFGGRPPVEIPLSDVQNNLSPEPSPHPGSSRTENQLTPPPSPSVSSSESAAIGAP